MVCQKGGKVTNSGVVGNILMQKFALSNQNRNNLLIKEIRTISTFFKFWKDMENFEILNLLVNFTKGAIFSWLIKR